MAIILQTKVGRASAVWLELELFSCSCSCLVIAGAGAALVALPPGRTGTPGMHLRTPCSGTAHRTPGCTVWWNQDLPVCTCSLQVEAVKPNADGSYGLAAANAGYAILGAGSVTGAPAARIV